MVTVNVGYHRRDRPVAAHGRGIQERVITIGGPAIREERQLPNSHRHAAALRLEYAGMEPSTSRVFLAG